jgi:hypothetical protein
MRQIRHCTWSLNGLVDCLFLLMVNISTSEVCDFLGPVHGLHLDLDGLGFVGGDDMIHVAHVAFGIDLNGVS